MSRRTVAWALAVLAAYAAEAAKLQWSRPTELSRGITMQQATVAEPRAIRYTAVRVDLKTPGLYLVGTDRSPDYGKPLAENPGLYAKKPDGTQLKIEPSEARTRREPVRTFMARAVKPVAEGGRGLDMALAFISSATCIPYDSTHANPGGLVLSEGKVVTERGSVRPLLVVRKDGTAAIVDTLSPSEYADVQVANTGAAHIRKDGKDIVPPTRNSPGARVAVGVSKDGNVLWIVAADDGKALTYNTGATHHDMNEAMESLGVPDAINTGTGGEAAISVRDRKTGAIRTLNIGSDGKEPGCCAAAIGVCYRPVAAKKSAAKSAPSAKPAAPEAKPEPPKGPEQIEGRISQARLSPYRDKTSGSTETTMRGQVRVSVSSDLARFKRPVLYVAALFDVEGMWRMYDVVCADQKVYWGHCLDQAQTPAQFSTWQAEVGKEAVATSLFGDSKHGFFYGYRIPSDRVKLLGYRLELWQNGGLVDTYDSDRTTMRRIGVPENWHEKGKHSGKIVYRWPPKDK